MKRREKQIGAQQQQQQQQISALQSQLRALRSSHNERDDQLYSHQQQLNAEKGVCSMLRAELKAQAERINEQGRQMAKQVAARAGARG
jgi:septal ring factor EnvC (AmiA/AmiB activator)